MKYLLVLSLFFTSFALADHFTGTYSLDTGQGTVTLMLQHSSSELTGQLSGSGESFSLTGFAGPEGAYGDVSTPDATLGFEAYLNEDDTVLGFYLFEYNASGEANQDTVQELVFNRQRYEANVGAAPLTTPPAAATNNPLAPAQAANPLTNSANPLASTDPLVGRFSDTAVTLTLQTDSAGYVGTLEFNGQTFPVTAQGSAISLQGNFTSDGNSFAFDAALQADVLSFSTGGSSYSLSKQATSVNPLVGETNNPANSTNILKPDPTSPIIAKGQYAELSQDNASAFVEALEFSLAQVGYTYTFTETDRQQMFQAMVQEYPLAGKEDQLVLAQARDIWNRVQTNWASSSQEDQQTFILGVLTLAFGEETVQQNLGSGSSTASAGSSTVCDDIDACMSKFNPEAYQDMVNASGCWASAGCTNYDSSTETYTYEEYNPTYDTYDTYDTSY